MTISRGFPQGSVLSPLLFNIFARKLLKQCTSSTFQFADDTTLATANPSLSAVAESLTASFYVVKEFCDSHELKINPEKTQLIVFKKPGKSIRDDFQLTLDNCTIKPHKIVKLLGVPLDQHLTFRPHIDNITNKCQGLLGILARATPYLTKELLKLIYTALIRSHMEYCSLIFSSAAKTHLKKLDVIHASYIEYHVMPMLIYYCCFSNWKILVRVRTIPSWTPNTQYQYFGI